MTEANQPNEIVGFEVNDLNQFIGLITAWHANRVATVEHMLQTPDGTELEFNNGDGTKQNFVCTGEFKQGFLIGLQLALMQLGTLPFVAEMEDEATTDDPAV